ncbi:MAG: hypothetical protein Fur0018_14270 [Anaerolineales bacterium]
MNGQRLKILMLEQNPSFVRLMRRALTQVHVGEVTVDDVAEVADARARLKQEHYDALVLDLVSLDDAKDSLDSFDRLHLEYPSIPIVVLSSNDDYNLSIQAMRRGAQDYLIKDKVTGQLLVRSLRYAIERQHMLDTMRRLAMLDELTGLYNGSGFQTLVQQQMQLSRRNERKFVLIVLGVEKMGEINAQFGRESGDRVLMRVADLLRCTFRSSDILARLGGDEFSVLAIDVDEPNHDGLMARLRANILSVNLQEEQGIHLSLRVGIIPFSGDERHRVEDLLARGRQNMVSISQTSV